MPEEKPDKEPTATPNERKTSIGNFQFSFLTDERYLNSPVREEIDKLNLPDLFISEAEKVVKDLEITQPLEIIVEIPSDSGEELNYVIESLGIGARTLSDRKILFQFDPANPHLLESLNKWQRRQIVHEINHTARYEKQETLLDALIFEGLAVNYEENWGGEHQDTPWGHALEPDQLQAEWQKAKKELNSPDYNHFVWFFGENQEHPNWTGYTLGTAIVKKYLELHPNEPMKELVKKPSQEILGKFNGL